MAPHAEKIEEHNWALVVEPSPLRALVSEMQKLVASDATKPESVSVELTVYFSDGFRQAFTSVEDVISLENPSWCSITGLFVVAERRSAAISCQFGPDWNGPRARVRAVGSEREWVYESCRRMEERVKSMSRWLPPVLYMTRRLGVFAVVMWAALVALFLISTPLSMDALFSFGVLLPGVIICGLVSYAVACYYLFHPLVFYIGQGARRHEAVVRWRWFFGTVVFGAILVGGLAMPVVRGWLGIS